MEQMKPETSNLVRMLVIALLAHELTKVPQSESCDPLLKF